MKPNTPKNEVTRLIYATRNSLKGYRRVFRDEAAFRFQSCILLLTFILGFWVARSWTEYALLVGSWALAMAFELGNSGIEATVDRIGPEHHDLSGKAKDAGSAMVMTAMMISGLIWLAVLCDRFL